MSLQEVLCVTVGSSVCGDAGCVSVGSSVCQCRKFCVSL